MRSRGSSVCISAFVQWPAYRLNAGGAIHALEVAKVLTETLRVTVVVPDFLADEIRLEYPTLAIDVVKLPRYASASTVVCQLFSTVYWMQAWGTYRSASTVIAMSHFLGDVLPLTASRRPGIVIVHHLVPPPWRRKGSFVRNLAHYVLERMSIAVASRSARGFVTSSEMVARELRRLGITKPIVVTTNAPRGARNSKPPSRPPGRLEAPLHVVYVGRLAPTKGLELLLHAWKHVSSAMPDVTLDIFGAGEDDYEQSLADLAYTLGYFGRVVFHGRVAEKQKNEAFATAALFAFPSREEGFGIVLAEAMSFGLPSVTLDLPIFRELFPRGRVVASDEPYAFAKAICEVLEDPAWRQQLGNEAFEDSLRFTWDRAAEADYRLLKDI